MKFECDKLSHKIILYIFEDFVKIFVKFNVNFGGPFYVRVYFWSPLHVWLVKCVVCFILF